MGPAARARLRLEEALYLTVAVSVAAAALVGLVLAELGHFSLGGAALVLAVASAGLLVMRRRALAWPLPRATRTALPAVLVLAVATSLFARPSEYIVGGRDPGAYVAAMGVIGRTGHIVPVDEAVLSIPPEDVELFYRHPDKPAYSWSRFMGFDLESPQTGRVVPQFFHLFPAFGAYLFQSMGTKGALATPPLFGVLGALGAYLCFVRLFGLPTALLGGLLLCVNVVQVWFARYPVSETMSQFLLFAALLALAVGEEEEDGTLGFLVLAGAFFGLSLLVRIDSVLLVVPMGLYLAARGLSGWGRRRLLALALPFGLLAAQATLHALLFAPKYLHDVATRRYWDYGWLWLLPAGLAVAGGALTWRRRASLRAHLLPAAPTVRQHLAVAVVVLAVFTTFVRPVLSAWAGGDGNDPAHQAFARVGAWLSGHLSPGIPQALGYRRLAAHDAQAFYRLSWFVTPLGLGLGVAGLVVALRRYEPRRLMLLLLTLTFAGFYFYKIRVYNDYFFALRRFLPVVLPALAVLAAFALASLWTAGGRGRRALAGLGALLLAGSFALQTAPLVRHVDWGGSVRFVKDIARRFGPRDVVVFEHAQSIHLLSLPLWASEGVNVLELARFDPDPDRLHHLVESWKGRYDNIYFVHTYRTDLCGLFLERVGDHSFGTFEWERAYVGPPRKPVFQALHFRISRVVPPGELRVPALAEIDVGGSDDLQVSGFFDKEGFGDRTYRWSGACGSLYVPGASGAKAVGLTTSVQNRPPSTRPPLVHVTLSGQPLGSFLAGPGWTEHVLPLPAVLPPGAPVLRLDVPGWRPANTDPASTDTRDLGVMLDRVRLLAEMPAPAKPSGP